MTVVVSGSGQSVVGTVTTLLPRQGGTLVRFLAEQDIVFAPRRLTRLWGPSGLPFKGYWGKAAGASS